MTTFLTRFGSLVRFVLSGFDRLRFRGESRRLNNARGLDTYLYQEKIKYVDFKGHCQALTEKLRKESEQLARDHGVPIRHLDSPRRTKKQPPARRPSVHPLGRIALLVCVESCNSYRCRRNAEDASIQSRKPPLPP